MDDEFYDDLMEVYAQGLVTCYGCGDDADGSTFADVVRDSDTDDDFDSSELPRFITYYSVNESGKKTKLYEYRYI